MTTSFNDDADKPPGLKADDVNVSVDEGNGMKRSGVEEDRGRSISLHNVKTTKPKFRKRASVKAKSNQVKGFLNPKQVRVLVQASCFTASFFRVLYFFVMATRTCLEGQPCIGTIFEPSNVAMVSR